MSDTLGKRSHPISVGGEAPNKDQAKKRDSKEHGARDTNVSDNAPTRVRPEDFANFPLIPEKSREVLRARGFRTLFPIQMACFAPVYEGKDLIARDLTGSGKTFAFGLPLVERLRANGQLRTGKLQAIMLAPTRELALQITNELQKLKHSVEEFRVVTVYGGVSVINQANALKSGADIFVGTTGRVLDHIERGNIDFAEVKTVVLDEADVMLKMGFKEDIEKILEKCNEECSTGLQMLLFSATLPDWVKDIAAEHMKQDFQVVDLAQDLTRRTARSIAHLAIDCPFHERLEALSKVLHCYGGNGRIIVFTSTKADANSLLLSDKISHDVEAMHGDIAQNQREVTMKRFREGKFQVLVATDVASRGLDIPEVELVIQLDPPRDTESYIHRSGRTARAGRAGTCLTFYNDRSAELIDKIEEVAGVLLERVGIPSDEDMIKANTKGILKKLLDVEPEVLPMFEDTAELLINQHHGDASKALQIALAFCSGHYKMANPDESLLTGRHQMVTIKMISNEEGGHLGAQACYAILYKYWAPRISDDVTVMRPFSDGSGVVFDIRSQWVDGFLDNFTHLCTGGRTPNFEVARAKSLPDCGADEAKKDREPKPEGDGGYDDQGGDDMRGGGGRPPMSCFNCGEEGHKSMDCPEPKKERGGGGGGDRGPMACFNCGEEGHKSMDCPEPRKERGGGDRGPMKCYNCQEEGHGARDCPEPKKPLTCYKCQGEGHMARDCPDA